MLPPSLSHDVLRDDCSGDDEDTKMPPTVLALQLLGFQMKTLTYTADKFITCITRWFPLLEMEMGHHKPLFRLVFT